ncbi:hypothetical protein AB0B06_32470 [Streptomyces sp. NPDC044989]|uniref:hypothetical protein n=1 Tax=Streptomyces sp. NPDC044989 TaxID=3154336 RepID=UPI0033C3910D
MAVAIRQQGRADQARGSARVSIVAAVTWPSAQDGRAKQGLQDLRAVARRRHHGPGRLCGPAGVVGQDLGDDLVLGRF